MKWRAQAEPAVRWLIRWGAPTFILLAAFGLRLVRLGAANVWWDEALAVWAIRKGLLGATLWTATDVHPPLFFWGLWSWARLVGESEFALRTFSVFAGVITVAVVYSLGTLVGGRLVGSLGALLISLARFHIWWSQEMRMYALAGLAGALSLYAFIRWLRTLESAPSAEPRTPNSTERRLSVWKYLLLYVFASASALYTIFMMAALILVENIVAFIAWLWPRGYRRKDLAIQWLGAQVALILVVASWLVLSWGRMRTWSVADPTSLPALIQLYTTLLATGISTYVGRYTGPVILVLAPVVSGGALALAGWWRRRWAGRRAILEGLALALTVVVPAIAIYLATKPRSLFYTPHVEARYFVPFASAFWLLLAGSIVALGKRWRPAGWLGVVAVLTLWVAVLPGYFTPRYLRDDFQTMTRTIVSQVEPGDAVLLDSGSRYPIWLYAYERTGETPNRPPMITVTQAEDRLSAERVKETLPELVEPYQRIWLAEVDVNLSDPDQWVKRWLGERYREVSVYHYGHNTLYLFDPQGEPPRLNPGYVPQHTLNSPTAGGGVLKGWELPVETYTSGDVIHLSLLWERVPSEPVWVALRSGGQVLLEQRADAGAQAEWQRQQFDFVVQPGVPAGDYRIIISPAPLSGSELGTLHIRGTQAQPRARKPAVTLNARLGRDIVLVGYTVRGASKTRPLRLRPGAELTLDLYWRAVDKPDRDYIVFTHLLGATHNPKTQGPVWAQHDGQPVEGGYSTSQWLVGKLVIDRHQLVVDEGAPPGSYQLEVGMYNAANGQRLAITSVEGEDLGDRVLLSMPIQVR